MNLSDGILQERDRLQALKITCGGTWERPEFFFYRAVWDNLMKRTADALGGHMEVTEMLSLYNELKEFEA